MNRLGSPFAHIGSALLASLGILSIGEDIASKARSRRLEKSGWGGIVFYSGDKPYRSPKPKDPQGRKLWFRMQRSQRKDLWRAVMQGSAS